MIPMVPFSQTVEVRPLSRVPVTPYPHKTNKNKIRFTPAQVSHLFTSSINEIVEVEAIKSGMQPGLTMVVGPPGTGKTDVAVQVDTFFFFFMILIL